MVEPGLGYLCLYLQFHISFHYISIKSETLQLYSSFIYIRECQRNRYTGSSRTGRRGRSRSSFFIKTDTPISGLRSLSRQFIFPVVTQYFFLSNKQVDDGYQSHFDQIRQSKVPCLAPSQFPKDMKCISTHPSVLFNKTKAD